MFKLIVLSSLLSLSSAQVCQVQVPINAISAAGTGVAVAGVATGLAGPWFVSAVAGSGTVCSQLVPTSAVFIEATLFDTNTGKLSVYYPLVLDVGSTAASPIIPPTITATTIVGIWFGANGMTTTLVDAMTKVANTGSVLANMCQNGNTNAANAATATIFGQFASCNSVAFFNKVNVQGNNPPVTPPIPGPALSRLGDNCPTTRHFSHVDQDQSDNVVSTYLVVNDGNGLFQVAQNTAANRAALNVVNTQGNGSDNRLLDTFILPAIGCAPYQAPDNIEPTVFRSSLALNELAAAKYWAIPPPPFVFNGASIGVNQAIVPNMDPMVVNVANGVVTPSLEKLNFYRQAVNQPVAGQIDPNEVVNYCNNLGAEAGPFFALHATEFSTINSPDIAVGTNLGNFLANRFVATWQMLQCQNVLGFACPISVTLNGAGVAASNNAAAKFGLTGNNAFYASTVPLVVVIGILGGIAGLFLIVNVIIIYRAAKSPGRV